MVLTKQLSIFIEMLLWYATERIYWGGDAFGRVEGIFLVETRGYVPTQSGICSAPSWLLQESGGLTVSSFLALCIHFSLNLEIYYKPYPWLLSYASFSD